MRYLSSMACGWVALAAAAPALASGLLDAPWRAFDAGVFPAMAPNSIAAGDLDADGDADLLLGLYYFGGPGIAVLESRGDGSYGDLAFYPTGDVRSVGDVALADIDGDGDLDALATVPDANFQTSLLAVWRNAGTGAFAARQTFATGPGPVGLAVADFTGDGFPDVVTADFGFFGTGDTVSLLAHNGQGGAGAGFLAPVAFFAGAAAERVRAGDFDGDLDLDLAVGRDTGSTGPLHGTAVLLNEDGAGSFGPPALYDMGTANSTRTSAVEVADLDRDGRLDLAGSGSGTVGVRRGAGDGSFGALQPLPLEQFSFTVNTLRSADLNGDLYPDLVAATPTGRALDGFHAILSDGAGGFRPAAFYEAAKQTWDTWVLDADGDTDLDVLTAANDSAVVTVHANEGAGTFFVPARNAVGSTTTGMDRADIDGDGDLDIATADSVVHILRNRGDGSFDPRFIVTVAVNPNEVKLRDLDGDGAPDILVSDDGNSDFSVSLNRGDGTFLPAVETRMGGSQGGSVDAFDLDGDGDLDVVVCDPGPVDPSIRLARNSGDGVSYEVMTPIRFFAAPFGIGGGDFDNDGHMDLVSATAFGLSVFPGRGDFSFEPLVATGVSSSEFVVTDIDLDGELDLVYQAGLLTTSTEWVGVLRGYGDGTFRFPNEYPGPIGLESAFRISSDIDVGDLSGDGLPDVILTSNAPNDVSVFRGNGDGTLAPQDRYGAGYSPSHSVVGDYDGDGAEDVASVISLPPSGIGNAVVLLAGRAGPTPDLELAIAGTCPGPMAITAAQASPGGRVLFLRATGTGAAVIPPNLPCAGTQLGLDASARPWRALTADGDGRARFGLNAPPAVCGVLLVQALDLTSCRTTNVAAL